MILYGPVNPNTVYASSWISALSGAGLPVGWQELANMAVPIFSPHVAADLNSLLSASTPSPPGAAASTPLPTATPLASGSSINAVSASCNGSFVTGDSCVVACQALVSSSSAVPESVQLTSCLGACLSKLQVSACAIHDGSEVKVMRAFRILFDSAVAENAVPLTAAEQSNLLVNAPAPLTSNSSAAPTPAATPPIASTPSGLQTAPPPSSPTAQTSFSTLPFNQSNSTPVQPSTAPTTNSFPAPSTPTAAVPASTPQPWPSSTAGSSPAPPLGLGSLVDPLASVAFSTGSSLCSSCVELCYNFSPQTVRSCIRLTEGCNSQLCPLPPGADSAMPQT